MSTGSTPIIALTANVMPEDRRRCLDAGMDDFLPKPVKLDDLRNILARWIRGA
jgi:CheY-like chemotaxis protein